MVGVAARAVGALGLVRDVLAQHRRILVHRPVGVGEGGQRLVLHLDQLDAVGGGVAVLGDDEGHLLALEQHLLVGQHRLHVPGQRRHVVQVQGFQILGGQHREHPGRGERRILVDALDAGVPVGGADEVAEHHARQLDVVHVVALALGEAGVLDALARAAETLELLDALLGGGGSLFAHCSVSLAAFISSAAARIALTMFW